MTDRHSFTDEEWQLITAAPYVVAFGAMAFDPTLTSLAAEIISLKKIVQEAAGHYGDNVLVQASVQDTEVFDQQAREHISGMQLSGALEMFQHVLTSVDLKAARDEAQDYRYFLYEVGERMTEAAGEGILGLGPKTSDREYDFLSRLEAWLGI